MEKFLIYHYNMLSNAVKVSGTYNPEENMYQFEETLSVEECNIVFAFLDWLHKNNLAFGSGNYEERVSEFINQYKNQA